MRHLLQHAAVMAAGLFLTGAVAAQTVSISTLPPGSINNVQTQAIAKVVQEQTGLQMRVITFNSPAASMGAVQAGQAAFTFMSNDEVGIAVRGKDEHEGKPLDKLQLAATVFPFKVGVLVRKDSGIDTVADLKGKRFPIGWQGFPQGIALSSAILATAGLTLDDTDGVPTANLLRAADDFKSGRLDATVFAVGAPKMAEVDAAVGIKFISLDNSEEAKAAMAGVRPEYTIASQVPLPHLNGVIGETNLMQYAMTVAASADADEETVYQVVKALHENKDALVAAHPSFNAMTPADLAVQQQDVPYHAGAIRYYKEVGIWPAE
ncbi:TAXI family TRAP transporter solute-binding subunit [Aquibium carbonis]|uniref:TAXI family TRAP transporter solute-binding subunit n=1 Tax=Aquibium carbonis TaxID=2495581 RepID=A0A429YPZ5_9HYPH|nr:TAXI family TRAP transporter solute-binding subunit [Aquibium carbonis]RST83506.1 TAXI family TRAP transporter solute-binding subunit [Aquibium carbonis]